MLTEYPVEATSENWFHECLMEMILLIHTWKKSGQKPLDWPAIIPAIHRAELRRKIGLKDRLESYIQAVGALTDTELAQVESALADQNQVARLLANDCDCEALAKLPAKIQQPTQELFEFGFELLAKLGIRDRQYHVIYDKIPSHMCPFCGCEYFDAPGAPREALDHYLAESKYPFAATNLQNLVPMGNKCNSRYKLAQDILFQPDNVTRRKSFYPYAHANVKISLERSRPFVGTVGVFSPVEWEIDFVPDIEEVTTWDNVFHIRERYKRDVLDVEFKNWLREFARWCSSATVNAITLPDVINALDKYARYIQSMGIKDRAFLKAETFRMLYLECVNGNDRVVNILGALVFGVGAFLNN
jgi:hypothetical protein